MCNKPRKVRHSVELADVFLQHGDAYIEQHGVSSLQKKVMNAIGRCRTSVLGGHVTRCSCCNDEQIFYNSCRNRHCPKCQTLKQLRWLENRKAELLPVDYFHVVFTIPHELNGIASYNPTLIYNLLFKAAWMTVDTLGRDKKRMDGQMGMLAMLHTWGQTLTQHIHLHCMIPGGALCDIDLQKVWKNCQKGFVFPVKVAASLFGKIFINLLKKEYQNQEITFQGSISELSKPDKFGALCALLRKKSWNVYAKPPFNGAEGGLTYLSRYISKAAISNERIISCKDGKVTFKWRDYSDNNKSKIMTLDAFEFIRRYLQHVLPNKFMRVRSYGILANTCKTKNIELIRTQLTPNEKKVEISIEKESSLDLILRLTGVDVGLCQRCKIGRLRTILSIPSELSSPYQAERSYTDTS